MDYSDIDADRQPVRDKSVSRSPSRTPRVEPRERSKSRSPPRYRDRSRSPTPRRYERADRRDRSPNRSRYSRDRSPPPASKPRNVPVNTESSNVVGVFGLSIRTQEPDLEHEFNRVAPVEKVVIVYDARSGRSRGFGFITMKDVEAANEAIKVLNGKELHGRRIRVDFSTTRQAHDPTPGIYKGEPRTDDGPSRGGSRYPPSSYRGGSRSGGYDRPPSYRDNYRGSSRGYAPEGADAWRRRASPPRRDRRSVSPIGRPSRPRRDYSRSPSPPRRIREDRYDGRDERVPPPARSRLGSHLDSPPRETEAVEPSRYY